MKIIYISGIDGCGKTTQAKLLVEALKQKDVNAEYMWLRWEPSFQKITNALRSTVANFSSNTRQKPAKVMLEENQNTKQDKWLVFKRKILANFLIGWLWLLFSSADYFIGYKKRFKKTTADVVVLDRYVTDFIIDQSINSNLFPARMDRIKQTRFLNKFHFPDYTIIIDIPAAEGCFRKSDGTSIAYLELRVNYYKSIAGNNTLHLNGLENIDVLHSKIKKWAFQKIEVKSI